MGLQQGNGVSGNAVPGNTLGNTGSGNTGLGSIGSGCTATGSSVVSGNRSMVPAQANLPPDRYPSSHRGCGAAGIVAIVCIAVGGVIAALGTWYYGQASSDMSAAMDGTYDGVPAETLSVLLFSPFVGLITALVSLLGIVLLTAGCVILVVHLIRWHVPDAQHRWLSPVALAIACVLAAFLWLAAMFLPFPQNDVAPSVCRYVAIAALATGLIVAIGWLVRSLRVR